MRRPSPTFGSSRDISQQEYRHFQEEKGFLPQHTGFAIDVGCGTGNLVLHLSDTAEHVIGLDISLEEVRRARSKQRESGIHNVGFLVADVNNMPFRDSACDYVSSRYTLHHTDLNTTLPELRRLLRPGGRLFLRDIVTRFPGLEHLRSYQVMMMMIRTPDYTVTYGLKSALRFLRYAVSPGSLRHLTEVNRLTTPEKYRKVHRHWLPGCRFGKSRRSIVFWEAPIVYWEAPVR